MESAKEMPALKEQECGSAYFWGCKKFLPEFDLVFPK